MKYESLWYDAWIGIDQTAIDPLTTRVSWDFNGGDKYNKVQGPRAAHFFETHGGFDVVATYATLDGRVYTRKYPTVVYSDVKQRKAAASFAMLSDLASRAGMVIDCANQTIEMQHPILVAPKVRIKNVNLVWRGKSASSYLVGHDFVLRDSTIDSVDRANDDGTGGVGTGVEPYREGRVSLIDVRMVNIGYGINGNHLPDGMLCRGLIFPDATGLREYGAWIQGANWLLYGCHAENSVAQHTVRCDGADGVVLFDCSLANINRRAGSHTPNVSEAGDHIPANTAWDYTKGWGTFHLGSFHSIIECIGTGPASFGPLGQGDGVTKPNYLAARNRICQLIETDIICNDPNTQFRVDHGTEGFFMDGCSIAVPSGPAVLVFGIDEKVYALDPNKFPDPPHTRTYAGRHSDRIILTENNKLSTRKGDALVSIGNGTTNVVNPFEGQHQS